MKFFIVAFGYIFIILGIILHVCYATGAAMGDPLKPTMSLKYKHLKVKKINYEITNRIMFNINITI